eukprot:TRINITY_DN3172_c0_g3_i2.p3 TRINITY_DN3172_c0_g3~~TRINITY_DN3172_c0_g3_i2.p3  ORF type:complete len:179 (-),score=0.57 TRINITY_DN3172_c0_g3_i2:47-583(-)
MWQYNNSIAISQVLYSSILIFYLYCLVSVYVLIFQIFQNNVFKNIDQTYKIIKQPKKFVTIVIDQRKGAQQAIYSDKMYLGSGDIYGEWHVTNNKNQKQMQQKQGRRNCDTGCFELKSLMMLFVICARVYNNLLFFGKFISNIQPAGARELPFLYYIFQISFALVCRVQFYLQQKVLD